MGYWRETLCSCKAAKRTHRRASDGQKKTRRFLDGSIAQIQSVHFQGFLCCKPVVIWCKLSAESRVYTVILPCAPAISPAASSSGNYDLNGQRSASPCAVAQQRLNRPRLKVCDSLLFTIHLLAHALAYATYTAKYRLHSRFVRICLPFTRSLYHFFGALLLEISTVPIRSKFKNRFPNASACFSQNR